MMRFLWNKKNMQFSRGAKSNTLVKLISIISFFMLLTYGHHFVDAVNANGNFLLDLYPNAAGAYSLRKLNSNYTGAAIRIRRDSDDTEQDIGFDADGNLDIDSIKSFLSLSDTLPGDTLAFDAAYSLRSLNSSYTGPLVRVRRLSDGVEQDIGFDSNGNFDIDALKTFLGIASSYSTTLPLDVNSAMVAFGLRQLGSSYTGNLVRVRRDSDDTEQDIGFDSNGDLDTDSLESFCGVNNCFVSIWYDQSGNAYDVSQTTHNRQPKIFDSASGLVTIGSRPAIDFYIDKGLRRNGMTEFIETVFSVVQSDYINWQDYHTILDSSSSAGGERLGGLMRSGDDGIHSNLYPSAVWEDSYSITPSLSCFTSITQKKLITYQRFSGTGNVTGISIGNHDATTTGGAAKEAEVIAYSTDETGANKASIEGNIASYFNIWLDKAKIVTWYDQSTNAYHLTQNNTDYQPELITTADSLDFPANSLALLFDGKNDQISMSPLNGRDMDSVFGVFNKALQSNNVYEVHASSQRAGFGAFNNYEQHTNYYLNGQDEGDTFNSVGTYGQEVIGSGFGNPSTVQGQFSNDSGIGKAIPGYTYLQGTLKELIFYDNDVLASREAIEANLNNYYKVFNNAYIVTWYDQSGNANDASQASNSAQPLIYNAKEGFVLDTNNKPALEFDGVDDWLDLPDNIFDLDNSSSFVLSKALSLPDSSGMILASSAPQRWFAPYISSTGNFVYSFGLDMNNEANSITQSADFNWNLHAISKSSTLDIFFNDLNISSEANSSSGAFSSGLNIGSLDDGTSNFANFQSQEIILYDDAKSNKQRDIRNAIANYYSLFSLPAIELAPTNSQRRLIIRSKAINNKLIEKLDTNENKQIDFNDLVTNMVQLKKANQLGSENLDLEELQQIDIDDNNTFNAEDEELIREGLSINSNFEYVDHVLETVPETKSGDINFKAARKFIKRFKRKKRRFKKEKSKQQTNSVRLFELSESYDCDHDVDIDKIDKICAIDFIREALSLKYSEKRVKKFLRKNKFVIK